MATISAFRPDEFPLLTSRVYATTSQSNPLLIHRGCFEPIPLEAIDTPTLKQRASGTIMTWPGYEAFGATIETRLGPTDRRPRVRLTDPGEVTYTTVPRGLEYEIPGRIEEDRQIWTSDPRALEMLAGKYIRAVHDTQREYRIANLIQDNGTSATLLAGTGLGKIGTVADVVGHLTQILDVVMDAAPVGLRPNLLVLGRNVGRTIRDMPQQRGIEGSLANGAVAVRQEQPRSLSWVETWLEMMLGEGSGMKVRVAEGYINSGSQDSPSLGQIWDENGIYALWDSPGMFVDGDDPAVALEAPSSVVCIDADGTHHGMYERDDGRVHYVYGDRREGETLLGAPLAYYYSEAA